MSKFVKKIVIAVSFVIAILLLGNFNNVNAAVTYPAIEVEKYSYNETNNELVVGVYINPGITLNGFSMTMTYDESGVNVIPYTNGVAPTYGEEDIAVSASSPFQFDDVNYGGGQFTLTTSENLVTTPAKTLICFIKFKVQGTGAILEENLQTNWFGIQVIELIDENGDVDDNEGIVKINPMPKYLAGFEVTNVVFDKQTYRAGDTVKLVSGEGTLKYSNPVSTKTIDLKDATYNIVQNQTVADYANPYVNFTYKTVTSNNVNITVIDTIEYMKLGEGYKTQYKYGDKLDKENTKIHIKFASKTEEVIKSLAELEQEGIITISGFNSTNAPKQTINQEVTLSVNYAEYLYTDELKLNLTIADEIQSYEWIKEPDKKDYKYGESLNTNGGKIKSVYTSTSYDNSIYGVIDVTEAIVTEEDGNIFDSTILGNRNLKVTCEAGKYLYYAITIEDYIKEITITPPTKTEYDYGASELDLTNGKVTITWASDEANSIVKELTKLPSVTENTVSNEGLEIIGFNSRIPGTQTITLKYYYTENGVLKSTTQKYNIKIIYGVESIVLTNNKMTIQWGYQITDRDLQNGNYQIVVTRTGNNITYVPVTAAMLTYNPKGNIGEQTGYVTYTYIEDGVEKTKKLEFYITLENYLKDIELSYNNITINYGDQLDNTTLNNNYILTPIMANGDRLESKLIREYITKINTQAEGTFSTKVRYEGIAKDFTIKIEDPILEIKLEDDEKTKIKTEYKYEENFELNGAKLTIVKYSGDIKVDLTLDMIKNYNSQNIGVQKLNIEYEDKKLEEILEVEVKDYIVDIILIKPTKTSYLPEEEIDLTGATVQTLSASGVLGNVVPVTIDMISGYNSNEMGTQRITVYYEGFEKTFDVILGVQTGIRRYQRLWSINNSIRNFNNCNICYIVN